MKSLLSTLIFFVSSFNIYGQVQEEKWRTELSFNMSTYSALSASIEKEFRYNDWYFGPRVELVNPFGTIKYTTQKGDKYMTSQIRVQLLRVEWEKDKIMRFGIAPFWMLGPIPREGFYQINTSIWAGIRISETKRIEAGFNTAREIPFQVSFRQQL